MDEIHPPHDQPACRHTQHVLDEWAVELVRRHELAMDIPQCWRKHPGPADELAALLGPGAGRCRQPRGGLVRLVPPPAGAGSLDRPAPRRRLCPPGATRGAAPMARPVSRDTARSS